MRKLQLLGVLGAALVAMTLVIPGAVAQTRSPCAPGGPATTPAQPNNPSQYPPNECGLRLGKTTATPGESVSVTGEGYAPNSNVSVEFRSAPVVVGSATANAQGTFSTTITIPTDATVGRHTIAGVGRNANGTARELTAEVTIVAPAAQAREAARTDTGGTTLPATGAMIALSTAVGLALVGIGAFAVVAVRRRSSGSAA